MSMTTDLHTAESDSAPPPDPEVPARASRRRFSSSYKLRVLAEYERLGWADKGAFLRREGLYTSHLTAWRQQLERGGEAALGAAAGRPPTDPLVRENTRLQKENARLQQDLARADRVIEVQRKLSGLLEQLATDSPSNNDGELKRLSTSASRR
jgi:transposase